MAEFAKLAQLLEQNLKLGGTQLYFLRHGQSIGNQAGSIVGWTDSKLSIKGREQSNKLFRSFYKYPNQFTSIHTSDLSRCVDTLNFALGFPSKGFIKTTALRQLNFGTVEGVHFDSLPAQQKAKINSLSYQAPQGENWPQARTRAINYLKKIGAGHHLICTHGGLMCALGYNIGIKNVVPNCSVVAVEMKQQLQKINFLWQFSE